MSDVVEKCRVCRALLDEEDLFCANCGTEAPNREAAGAVNRATMQATHNFLCGGCGASMSYDASAQTLRCPFCGSTQLEKQQDTKMLGPSRVVPFLVPRDAANEILHRWLGSGFFRPSDLAVSAVVEKMTPVFVPYWVFSARTFTFWTADTSHLPSGARGDWAPLTGEHHGNYAGVLIGASSALTPNETAAICPFELAKGVDPSQVDLDNIVYEQFRVQRKYARPLAQQAFEEYERQACAELVPGSNRNLKVNVRLEALTGEPVLLPVWIMAYRYRDQVFRFLINGQTGQPTGQAPTSWLKMLLVVGVAGAAILFMFFLMLICAGGGGR